MRPNRLITILVLLALVVPAPPAYAGGIVSVCDEAHLLAALADGGTVTFSCSGTITLTAEITIAAVTILDGSGQTVTISGNHAVRVFTVNSQGTLTLNKLTIADGYVAGATFGYGGGIFNGGTLTVSNCTFSGNNAFFAGGGIDNSGTLKVSNSTFSDNRAGVGGPSGGGGYGGGISNGGTLTVTNSTFINNRVHGVHSGYGGGIYNFGTLTVSNSTFSDNFALVEGGGIYNHLGALTLSNSTFSGNWADYGGGGIVNSGTLTVSNSTFSGNIATDGGGIYNSDTLTVSNSTFSGNIADTGGGIYNYSSAATVSNSTFSGNSGYGEGGGIATYGALTLKNTIVANNQPGGNCFGTIIDGIGNLVIPMPPALASTTTPGSAPYRITAVPPRRWRSAALVRPLTRRTTPSAMPRQSITSTSAAWSVPRVRTVTSAL